MFALGKSSAETDFVIVDKELNGTGGLSRVLRPDETVAEVSCAL